MMDGSEHIVVAAAYIPVIEAHALVETSSSGFSEIALTPQDIRRIVNNYWYVFRDEQSRLTITQTKSGGSVKFKCNCGTTTMGFTKMHLHLWKSHDTVLAIKDVSTVPRDYMEFLDPTREKRASPTRAVVPPPVTSPVVEPPPRAVGDIFVDEVRLPIPGPDADEDEVRAFNSQLVRDGRLMYRDGRYFFHEITVDELRQSVFNGVDFSPELEAYIRRTWREFNLDDEADSAVTADDDDVHHSSVHNLADLLANANLDDDAVTADEEQVSPCDEDLDEEGFEYRQSEAYII
jgi:hypothetical protein